ncbi:MAG: OmpA family protein [Pseudomonadota bacterium]
MRMFIAAAAMAVLGSPVGAQQEDAILSERFPGATLITEATIEYDALTLFTGPMTSAWEAGETMTLEGRIRTQQFEIPKERSVLEVYRAYERSITSKGFSEIFACANADETGCNGDVGYHLAKRKHQIRLNRADQRYGLFERQAGGVRELALLYVNKKGSVNAVLEILSTDAVEAELEMLSADEIAAAIAEGGTAAIYGIEFATDSADLLPASDAVIAEMAGYMANNPGAEILLVGHTDNVGALDYNMGLSQRRAEAVRAALVDRHGISAGRLGAHGVGFLAPAASNDSEGGRAANRRVEMVRR